MTDNNTKPSASLRWVENVFKVEPGEGSRVVTAFVYIFLLLACWYLLRPVRESIGSANSEVLPYLYTGTFVSMLLMVPVFGWLVSNFPRKRFVPAIYLFFFLNLLFFITQFRGDDTHIWLQRGFFIWASVFNLFVVSVFWSFMADIFRPGAARRLFGLIVAGGSVGALVGSQLAAFLATDIGSKQLMMLASVVLLMATGAAVVMGRFPQVEIRETGEETIGGGIFDGFTEVIKSRYLIYACLMMLLHNFAATFLYNGMAVLVDQQQLDFDTRTQFFAGLNLIVQVVTFVLQFLITARLVARFGISGTLIVVPLVLAAGFSLVGSLLTFTLFAAVQVAQRSMNYGVLWPVKEMLFTVVPRSVKYKSKNFIDTVVYRGSDVTAAWTFRLLFRGFELGLAQIAWLLLPVMMVWTFIAWRLGRIYKQLRGDDAPSASRAVETGQ